MVDRITKRDLSLEGYDPDDIWHDLYHMAELRAFLIENNSPHKTYFDKTIKEYREYLQKFPEYQKLFKEAEK